MTTLKQLMVMTSLVALACAGLSAQVPDLRAAIPFDFYVGAKLMPAGEYAIHQEGSMLFVRSTDRGEPASVLFTYGATAEGRPGAARLNFDRYGNEHFLAEIWNPYSPEARVLPRTARQKELASRFNAPVKDTVTFEGSK